MDAEDASPLPGSGLSAEQRFSAETAGGRETLTFSASANSLRGRSLLAHLRILDSGGSTLAEADVPREPLYIPDPALRLTEILAAAGSGNRPLTVDAVLSYADLIPGATYTVRAHLTAAGSGE